MVFLQFLGLGKRGIQTLFFFIFLHKTIYCWNSFEEPIETDSFKYLFNLDCTESSGNL